MPLTPDDHAAAADDLLAPLDRRALAGGSLAEGDRTRAAVAHALLSLRAPEPIAGVTQVAPVTLPKAGPAWPTWQVIDGHLAYTLPGGTVLAVAAVTPVGEDIEPDLAQHAYNDLAALIDAEAR